MAEKQVDKAVLVVVTNNAFVLVVYCASSLPDMSLSNLIRAASASSPTPRVTGKEGDSAERSIFDFGSVACETLSPVVVLGVFTLSGLG